MLAKERIFGFLEKIPTMIGTAALGLLGQWLLRIKFPETPLLHGGYWILGLALVGMCLDKRHDWLPAVWKQRPPLLSYSVVFFSNVITAFWIVMLLDQLGLGFDTSMLGWALKFFILVVTALELAVMGDSAGATNLPPPPCGEGSGVGVTL